jgi:drug/metabolite transporter (DMT)-like permease
MIFIWLTARLGWMMEVMKIQIILGIVMIIAGGALLAYGGFTTTKRENIIDVGPIKVEADVREKHQVPPVISWALLGGGVVVLLLGAKKK